MWQKPLLSGSRMQTKRWFLFTRTLLGDEGATCINLWLKAPICVWIQDPSLPATDRPSISRCVWKQHDKNKTWAGGRQWCPRDTSVFYTYLIPLFWLSPLECSSNESVTHTKAQMLSWIGPKPHRMCFKINLPDTAHAETAQQTCDFINYFAK